MYLDLLPQRTAERIYGWLEGCEYHIKKFYKHKDTRQSILLDRETNLIATALPRLVNTTQALYTILVANISSQNTNTCKAPFGRAPTSSSLSYAFTIHALFKGALCLSSLSSHKASGSTGTPSLIEPVGAEKLVFWVSLLPLCERREESEKVLL
jgi:hypothetical protein